MVKRLGSRGVPWTGVWGLADQSLVSATNFITMVLLARTLAPRDFGVFLLVYTAALFLNELQKSLITRPHNVLAASLSERSYATYTGTAAALQMSFAGLWCLLALAAGLLAHVSNWGPAALFVALGPAVLAWQLQEFLRQTFYTKGLAEKALVCDIVSYGGQAVLIVLLFSAGRLTGVSALYALAGTSALSAMCGFWLVRGDMSRPQWGKLRESWQFGRWLLGDSVGGWLSAQLYPLLTAAIVGVSGVAVLRAVQNLVAPGHIVMNALVAYGVPRAARVQDRQGSAAMKSFVFGAWAVAAAPLIAYWIIVSVLAVPALKLLYGETYAAYGPLVGLTAVVYCAHFVTLGQTTALLALGRTNTLFGGRLVAIAVTFTAGIVLVWLFGVYGAVIGSALSFLGLGLYLAHALRRRETSAQGAATVSTSRGGLAIEGDI
jgi:O-antigen/teichoic acid export membrane protein